jgi:hypothetical protein
VSERGQMRRRLRERRRVREALLLDLGALVYELHRQGRRAPELLQRKAAELSVVDEEVRELERALDGSAAPAAETAEVEALREEDVEDPEVDADDELEEEEEDTLGEGAEEGELEEADDADDADEPDDEPALAEREEPRA